MDEAKPFKIPKREVWEAFKRVKAIANAAMAQNPREANCAYSDQIAGLAFSLGQRQIPLSVSWIFRP